jgi:hypothetical protein
VEIVISLKTRTRKGVCRKKAKRSNSQNNAQRVNVEAMYSNTESQYSKTRHEVEDRLDIQLKKNRRMT